MDASPTQTYRERLPAPELRDDIACVWSLGVSPDGPSYEHRTVPNGSIELSYVLGSSALVVTGTRRGPKVGRVDAGSSLVGIRFRPGVAPAVLGATPSELADAEFGADELWGRRATVLLERLGNTATPAAAARVLENEIVARAADAPATDPIVTAAMSRLQPWRRGALPDWATDFFISPRQLRRRFVAALGYGPKTYQRIQRFQGFLALSQESEHDLARLAIDAGYADQAHLTRECRELTGLPPARFLEETRLCCGANHNHDVSYARLRRALLATA